MVYPFAERGLDKEILDKMHADVAEFEEREAAAREAGLKIVKELSGKYLA